MNKQEFLQALRSGLCGLPPKDIEERVAFYAEMIDDRIEDGLSEHEAVSEIGSVESIIAQILADTPLTTLVKEKVMPRRTPSAWEIVLLILGSPIWLSLLIAAAAVVIAVYVVIWSVVISLWAVGAAVAACAIGGIAAAIIFAAFGRALTGAAMLGGGLCCVGLAILFFFLCAAVTKGVIWLTKNTAIGLKFLFVGKGAAQ